MGKRLLTTPRSKVRQALRQVWLRSRERLAALQRESYKCQECHRKQSKAKGREFSIEVHHVKGEIDWEKVIDLVFQEILVSPDFLKVVCPGCHGKEDLKPKTIGEVVWPM